MNTSVSSSNTESKPYCLSCYGSSVKGAHVICCAQAGFNMPDDTKVPRFARARVYSTSLELSDEIPVLELFTWITDREGTRIFERPFVVKDVTTREASSISGSCAVTLLAAKGGMVCDEGTVPCYDHTARAPQVHARLLFRLGVDFASKVNKPRCYRQ